MSASTPTDEEPTDTIAPTDEKEHDIYAGDGFEFYDTEYNYIPNNIYGMQKNGEELCISYDASNYRVSVGADEEIFYSYTVMSTEDPAGIDKVSIYATEE